MIKKAIKISAPYLLAVLWFLYCLSEIKESVLNHFGYEWCVINSYALGVFFILILIMAKPFKKDIYVYLFVPILFFLAGFILNIIGGNIPCCTGG